MVRTTHFLAAIGIVVAAVVGSGIPAGAATEDVELVDAVFSPDQSSVDPGDRVRWTNKDGVTHRVRSDPGSAEDFDSGFLNRDETSTHTFTAAGTFRYHCEIHSRMTGVVVVNEPATSTTEPPTSTTEPPTTTTEPPTTTTEPPTTTTEPPTSTTEATTTTTSSTTTTVAPARSTPLTTTATTASSTTTTATTATSTTTTTPPPTSTTATTATTATTVAAPPTTSALAPPSPEEETTVATGSAAGAVSEAGNRRLGRGEALALAALSGTVGFGIWTLWKLRPGRT